MFTSKILGWGLGVALVAGIASNVGWWINSKDLKIQLLTVKNELIHTNNELENSKKAIADQNTKIVEAEADSAENKRKVDELSKNIKDVQQKNRTLIDNLRNSPTPQTCEELEAFLINSLEDLSWQE